MKNLARVIAKRKTDKPACRLVHEKDPARELPIIAELMNETRDTRSESTAARSDRHVIWLQSASFEWP